MAESIGHYDILGVAEAGPQGPVYRARDTLVGRTVAIRVLDEAVSDPWKRAHLLENVRPFTALSHPHVATLFEAGEHNGRIYLVYEYVPGEKLGALAAGQPLNLRRALDLAIQVADALAEAHALDLVHGALTPSSVVVTPKGRAKILDFGLPCWREPDWPAPYASPEQTLGQPADHRSDLFSLGVMLYELLTGRIPARSAPPGDATPGDATPERAPAPYVPLRRANLEVPASVDRIVAKALAEELDDRYQDATILASDLRAAAAELHARDGGAAAQEAAPGGVRSSWLRIGGLALLLAAATGAAAWQWREPVARTWQRLFGIQFAPAFVVVPFEVSGADAARAHLGPGLAEELATRLGHVPGVIVLGRSSLRAFTGKDPRAVAERHRAALAVTARVSPQDANWQTLDIRVTLVSRDSGDGVWSRQYSVKGRDLLSAQAKIAEDIASGLKVAPAPSAALRRAGLRLSQPAALDAYLQARTAMAELDTNRAVLLYDTALQIDPGLVEARAGLAEALHASVAFEHRLGYAEVERRLRQTAAEAVTADPDLAHAQLAMGLASRTLDEALEHLRRAIDLDPSDTAIYLAAGALLRDIEPATALRVLSWARGLDPEEPRTRFEAAATHLVLNQPDQTLVEAARGQALAPSLPWWDALRLRTRLAKAGDADAGISEGGRSLPEFPPGVVMRAAVLQAAGQRDAAIAALTGVVRLFPAFCEARAVLAGLLRSVNRSESIRLASEIYAQAERTPLSMARCAAMAGAATADGREAGAWIDRAATSDEGLLLWGMANGVLSAQAGLHQRSYPWSLVGSAPDVTRASRRLETVLARSRATVARILDGLDDPLARSQTQR
ncbi:MAG: protein kinase [Acidobacteriota bacterium]